VLPLRKRLQPPPDTSHAKSFAVERSSRAGLPRKTALGNNAILRLENGTSSYFVSIYDEAERIELTAR
jgi:hypothetical protein